MVKRDLYDLKKKEEVSQYIRAKYPYQFELLSVEEIGNGNMNYVYRIKDLISRETVILKYAAVHTRISKSILVSTDRIKTEAQVIGYLASYVPDYVPGIYQYDEENSCILMEDYQKHRILRDQLLLFEPFKNFAEHITTYLVKSIFPTSALLLDEAARMELDRQFSNSQMCDITKTFVFTEPFDAQSGTNAIYEPNREFVEHEVFQDAGLLSEIERLKEQFQNKKEALLHGDLHTGSIFTNKSSLVVFDYEFAFVGPIGFDLGNLIANLIFSWLNADASSQKGEYLAWLEETIIHIIDLFVMKFYTVASSQTGQWADDAPADINIYLEGVIRDTASYAGVELIRRVVGIAHVQDITSIHEETRRVRAERAAIQIGKRFILSKDSFGYGTDFVKVIKETLNQIKLPEILNNGL